MKFWKAIIYIMYLIVYVYAAHKITIAPDETYWGYICVYVFGFLFIWTVSMIVSSQKKNENKEEKL